MYNSQYYTCEQIDERLLQGYLDDYNTQTGQSLTKAQFLTKLGNLFSKEGVIDNIATQIGYYECDTAAGTAAKVITVANYDLFAGGSMKVKFANRNTANNATLNVNSKGAKALYYQGERASATNSWDAEEVVEIYYDGTSYYANNVKGGSGSGVYDVSKEHPTSGPNSDGKFTLEYILNSNNVNELIPVNKRYPGMSIQFVSTSDNKYVQYRLTAQNFTTDVTKWQGVDEKPVVGSKNPVESGGVFLNLLKSVASKCKNLFDVSKVTTGYKLKSNGSFEENINWLVSDYIPVSEGVTYAVTRKNGAETGSGSAYHCFYDINGNCITSASVASNSTTVTAPQGAVYLRISIYYGQNIEVQVEAGSNRTTYEPYNPIASYLPTIVNDLTTGGADKVLSAEQGRVLKELAKTLVDTGIIGKVDISCKNLFDVSKAVSGLQLKNDGSTNENPNWLISDYIPVTPGTTYSITRKNGGEVGSRSAYHCFYDINGNCITSASVASNSTTITAPQGAVYLRISIYYVQNIEVQVEVGTSRTAYEPYNPIRNYLPVIVNDLTTGGTDKTLSAEQGKVLKEIIDDNDDILNSILFGDSAIEEEYNISCEAGVVISRNDHVLNVDITKNRTCVYAIDSFSKVNMLMAYFYKSDGTAAKVMVNKNVGDNITLSNSIGGPNRTFTAIDNIAMIKFYCSAANVVGTGTVSVSITSDTDKGINGDIDNAGRTGYGISLFANKPYMYHFSANSFIKDGEGRDVIASESLNDIALAARLGFAFIEANIHKTADDKYICIHGSSGAFGPECMSIHTDVISTADLQAALISSKTLDFIKANVRYASFDEKFQTEIPTLEEFCKACKINNIGIFAGTSEKEAILTCIKYLGDNVIVYNPPYDIRAYFNGYCQWYRNQSGISVEYMLNEAKRYGSPFIYSPGPTIIEELINNNKIDDFVETMHNNGFLCGWAGAYTDEATGRFLLGKGFDFCGSGHNVNPFEANYEVFDVDSENLPTTTGSILNGIITLSEGQSVTCGNNTKIIGKGYISIKFSGTLVIGFGSVGNRTITSDGNEQIVITDYFYNRNTELTITATDTVTITEFVYKTSKC